MLSYFSEYRTIIFHLWKYYVFCLQKLNVTCWKLLDIFILTNFQTSITPWIIKKPKNNPKYWLHSFVARSLRFSLSAVHTFRLKGVAVGGPSGFGTGYTFGCSAGSKLIYAVRLLCCVSTEYRNYRPPICALPHSHNEVFVPIERSMN